MKQINLDKLLAAPWIHLKNTESTNKYILDIPDSDTISGLTVTALLQEKGVGRQGRIWNSPHGGLYLSMLIIPESDENQWHMISLILACAAAQSIKSQHPDITPLLKWPNDILINNRKVAGILVQSVTGSSQRIVAGLGVNVTTNPLHLPSRPLFPATVINQESAIPPSVNSLGKEIRRRFFELYLDWLDDNTSILNIWNSLSVLKNKLITISHDNKKITGLYSGIRSDGTLLVNVNNSVREYRVGDIVHFEEI